MHRRASAHGEVAPTEVPTLKRGHNLVDNKELEYLATLTHRTFQDCLQTALVLLADDPTIAKHATRPHATLHHERLRLRSTVDAFVSSFHRRLGMDESFAAYMGFSDSRLPIDLSQASTIKASSASSPSTPIHAGFRWAGLPSSLAMISDRDFCGLERAESFRDASGTLGWAYTFVSMEHACCPSQPNYVRGWVRLTHMCLPSTTGDGFIDILSFAQVDFRGNTPQFVVRQVLKQFIKDAHGAMHLDVQASRRRRASSASHSRDGRGYMDCLDTSRTWTLLATSPSADSSALAATPPPQGHARTPSHQPISVFRAMANALVDPQSPPIVVAATESPLPSTCSICEVAAPFAMCHVCDAVSCHTCSGSWCVVHKYQANVILCDRCHGGLILHQGQRSRPNHVMGTPSKTHLVV